MPKLSPHRGSTRPAKRYRLEARVTDEQKELFQRAADLQGRSLTDFVIASVHSAATSTIESAEIIRLNAAESRKLAESLLRPAREPNEAMRAAKQHYHGAVRPR
jgi:uncharacterized protein (DUF1778 family)